MVIVWNKINIPRRTNKRFGKNVSKAPFTTNTPKDTFDLISQDAFATYMQKADLVITHGGVGSIITALNMGMKVIAASRLAKYREYVNDHQLQIVKCFERKRYVLPLYDLDRLSEVIEKSKSFIPRKFESNREYFLTSLKMMIDF